MGNTIDFDNVRREVRRDDKAAFAFFLRSKNMSLGDIANVDHRQVSGGAPKRMEPSIMPSMRSVEDVRL